MFSPQYWILSESFPIGIPVRTRLILLILLDIGEIKNLYTLFILLTLLNASATIQYRVLGSSTAVQYRIYLEHKFNTEQLGQLLLRVLLFETRGSSSQSLKSSEVYAVSVVRDERKFFTKFEEFWSLKFCWREGSSSQSLKSSGSLKFCCSRPGSSSRSLKSSGVYEVISVLSVRS